MATVVPFEPRSRQAAQLGISFVKILALVGFFVLPRRVMVVEQARSWPVVPATILTRSISNEFAYTVIGRWSNYDRTEERLRASYRYSVHGVAYESSHLSPNADFVPMTGGVRSWLQVGAVVDAHVNPEDPTEVVIDVRRSLIDILTLGLWLLGVAWLVLGWRKGRLRARKA
jgi:hypothetical protein